MTKTVKKKAPEKVRKPYLKGSAFDRNTIKRAFGLFAVLILIGAMSILVCSMFLVDNQVIRIGLNLIVEILVLMICFNSGANKGNDDTVKGEMLYQHQDMGKSINREEQKICFNPFKGFIIGVTATSILLVMAIILALTSEKVMTTAGTLPSWLQVYEGRNEMSYTLAAYNRAADTDITSILRTVLRMELMPFVSMIGGENKEGLLLLDRLSPVLVLLPGIAFGCGYLQGPALRTKVHTEINENKKKRIRKEKKARKARMNQPKKPQQLN